MLDLAVNNEKFAEARYRVLGEKHINGGFGTLKERSLHKILKFYIEPDDACHEVPILGSIADIKNDNGIYEVQTKRFSYLVPKLRKYLDSGIKVSVIYPLHQTKAISYIDNETGEITKPRISSKHENVFSAVYELYNIREFIGNENLNIYLVLLVSDEYKMKGVRVKVGKKYRATERVECIPRSIKEIVPLNTSSDFKCLIPKELPYRFSAADYNKLVGKKYKYGHSAIRLLLSAGIISEGVKEGRRIVYTQK